MEHGFRTGVLGQMGSSVVESWSWSESVDCEAAWESASMAWLDM
jgi:hypothetical protein